MSRDFDAIVIGSGPGGSAASEVLTAAGWSVLIFERGRNHLIDLDDPSRLLSDFSNDAIKFGSRHFLGPDPWLDPRTFRRGETDGDHLHVGEVNSLPTTVGGGGVHADGKVPRFREDDFTVLSSLGPVDGASIADWPIGYDDLEPFYAAAERLIGVAGDADANPFAAWRSGPYPMPPGPTMYASTITIAAAERLGYHPYPGPSACNSVPYDDRPACNNCGFCAYYGCPIHAKGDPVAPLRRALVTGRAELRPESFVSRILIRNQRAYGVDWIDSDGNHHTEHADHIVVAAGGMETPRVLLLSGLEHPHIGRNLMFHFQTMVMAHMPMRLHGHKGRSVTTLHDDHIVIDDAARAAAQDAGLPWIKGGLVEHTVAGDPILEAKLYPWGERHKDLMRTSPMREHMLGFCMQGEDLPQPTNRVDLDPTVRDIRGVPVARTTYAPHRHELVASEHHAQRLQHILDEAGALRTFTATSPQRAGGLVGTHSKMSIIPASRHIVGTARMGNDPTTSVCDPWGRLHHIPNILIADSSLFPTGAGYGPTLTLVALALRNTTALTR